MDRYGGQATIIVMSDHGFANFGRQFNLNSWLRDWGYLGPRECTSIMKDVDWSQTVAYGLGINGLYLNLKGRERDGIVEPGDQREALLTELIERLEAVTDVDGQPVIRGVYRSDQIYQGNATAPGARPDRRLPPRLSRLVGDVPGRPDRARSCSTTTRPGAPTTAPTRSRCPACCSATGPSAASRRRSSTWPRRSWPSSACRRRRRWSERTCFPRDGPGPE